MTTPPYSDEYIEARGLRFHYTQWPGDGPAIVCLHGITQTAHSWDEFAATAAARGYRVVCLDQRGHGDSAWPAEADYSRNTQADDIEAVVAGLAIDRPILVAMSMGGLNAMTWSSRPSSQPLALVLVDISPEVRAEGVEEIRNFIEASNVLPSFEDFVERAHAFNPRRSLENIRSRLSHNLRRTDDGNWTWKYDPRLRNPGGSIGEIEKLWEEIPAIACPVLAVKGAESPVVSTDSLKRLVSTITNCRSVEIAEASHSVMGDQPEAFARKVLDFLSAVPGD